MTNTPPNAQRDGALAARWLTSGPDAEKFDGMEPQVRDGIPTARASQTGPSDVGNGARIVDATRSFRSRSAVETEPNSTR